MPSPLIDQWRSLLAVTLVLLACWLGVASMASAQVRRVPAEWEPQEALWLQWPRSYEAVFEPAYAEIAKVVAQYQPLRIVYRNNTIENNARAAITSAGGDADHPNISYHRIGNDSAWMRDNGPVYVEQDGEMRIQNWDFDAWGGAFGNFPYADDDAVPIEVGSLLGMPVDTVSIVHERGNLEFNGVDTVMLNWNVIGNPNRGNGYANKAAAEVDLMSWFGVTQVVWADGPIIGDLTAGHIDGIARFIDANTAVVANCTVAGHCQPGGSDDQVYDATAANLIAAGFQVIRMDFEAAITYGGSTFDANYMNWGVGNGWVILVGFNNPASDNAAKALLETWYPNRDVYVIEMLDSWINGGGVHCHTNDQPVLAVASCTDPAIANSNSAICDGTASGAICTTLACDAGYSQTGVDPTCTGGSWGPLPSCEPLSCVDPAIANSNSAICDGTASGATCSTLSCDVGHEQIGADPSCSLGAWGALPSCSPLACSDPSIANSNSVVCDGTASGGTCSALGCDAGYEKTGADPSCSLGAWGALPSCGALACSDPSIANSNSVVCDETASSGTCGALSCDAGHEQIGADPSCSLGAWGVVPSCSPLACSDPSIANSNSVLCDGTASGGTCSVLSCDAGYEQIGADPFCNLGTWAVVPSCQENLTEVPSMSTKGLSATVFAMLVTTSIASRRQNAAGESH